MEAAPTDEPPAKKQKVDETEPLGFEATPGGRLAYNAIQRIEAGTQGFLVSTQIRK